VKIVMVSMDTVRADRLSCLGYDRATTPNLDRIASEGALFSNAFASDVPTQPSHTAVFTGRYGINSEIVSHFHPPAQLHTEIPWLPAMLQATGRPTGAVDHLFVMKDWFIRGYDDYMPPHDRSRSPADVVNALAFPWITTHKDDDFFLFLHFWDAHIPYVPPEPYKTRFAGRSATRPDPDVQTKLKSRPSYPLFKRNNYDVIGDIVSLDWMKDLYDAELAFLDSELGRLYDHLDTLGILDDTLLIIFGDHGEIMTEHDAWFDHAGLYDEVVHVPLIIRYPPAVPPSRVDQMVQPLDIFPTVLELTGIPLPHAVDGTSLLPAMQGHTHPIRDWVPLSEATWQASRGIRTPTWKYIRSYDPGIYPDKGPQLFHLPTDPTEQTNVATDHPTIVTELDQLLQDWLDHHLQGRPDPTLDVITQGLPAVRRLQTVIEEDQREAARTVDLRSFGLPQRVVAMPQAGENAPTSSLAGAGAIAAGSRGTPRDNLLAGPPSRE
jgi:arylsulfatase